ncbi:MAG: D-alanyl-D-alanine carboxypeptidase [Parasporobacterium sp.]|nr:D-alanyl-D-alanine carboxypeptidase [Parasporobacterium sp.]
MKKFLFLIILAATILCCAVPAFADEITDGVSIDNIPEDWPVPPVPQSGSVLVVEANTGAVLYSQNIDTQRYPASTTKLMTCLIALEKCSMNEIVTFSETACDIEEGSSNIGAVAGEQMTMRDVLYGLMVASGNECANALAEHIAGSIEAFADMMNARAEELGCTGTHFTNPHGLYDKNHYTTVHDMYRIARAAFNNSALVEILSHANYTIEPTNMNPDERRITSTVELIVPNSDYYNEYVIGGKTGYLPEAGRCLVSFAKKDSMDIITIVFFCADHEGVFTDTQMMLDYVFSNFSIKNISESESRFVFAEETANVVLDSSAQLLVPNNVPFEKMRSKITFAYDLDIDQFNKAKEEAGIFTQDGRHLFAMVDYYVGDYRLGSVNVLIDDNLQVSEASFINMYYINIWPVLGVVAVIVIVFIILTMSKKRKVRKRVAATGDRHKVPPRREQ